MRDRGDCVCADRAESCPRFDVRPVVHGMVDPELVRRLVLDDQRTAAASDRALDVLAQRGVQRDAPRAIGKQTGLHRLGQNIAGATGATVGEHVECSLNQRLSGCPPKRVRSTTSRDRQQPVVYWRSGLASGSSS